jgi:hypothetical protein
VEISENDAWLAGRVKAGIAQARKEGRPHGRQPNRTSVAKRYGNCFVRACQKRRVEAAAERALITGRAAATSAVSPHIRWKPCRKENPVCYVGIRVRQLSSILGAFLRAGHWFFSLFSPAVLFILALGSLSTDGRVMKVALFHQVRQGCAIIDRLGRGAHR